MGQGVEYLPRRVQVFPRNVGRLRCVTSALIDITQVLNHRSIEVRRRLQSCKELLVIPKAALLSEEMGGQAVAGPQ